MGEIISARAPVEQIVGDTESALSKANALGGQYKTLAEMYIGPVIGALTSTKTKLAPIEQALNAVNGDILALNNASDDLIQEEADYLWNKLGRPGSDPYYDLIFPGGTGIYVDAKPEHQPAKMYLLCELLESGVHPKLDPTIANACAQRIRSQADAFQAKIDMMLPLRNKYELLTSVWESVGRSARGRLLALKRAYLAAGISEADIHQVIPDRPSQKPKPKASQEPSKPEGEPK